MICLSSLHDNLRGWHASTAGVCGRWLWLGQRFCTSANFRSGEFKFMDPQVDSKKDWPTGWSTWPRMPKRSDRLDDLVGDSNDEMFINGQPDVIGHLKTSRHSSFSRSIPPVFLKTMTARYWNVSEEKCWVHFSIKSSTNGTSSKFLKPPQMFLNGPYLLNLTKFLSFFARLPFCFSMFRNFWGDLSVVLQSSGNQAVVSRYPKALEMEMDFGIFWSCLESTWRRYEDVCISCCLSLFLYTIMILYMSSAISFSWE